MSRDEILLMFYKCFNIGTFDIPQFCFAQGSIQTEEEYDGREGTINGSSLLVVRQPFIQQIALEVLLLGEVQGKQFFKDACNGVSLAAGIEPSSGQRKG